MKKMVAILRQNRSTSLVNGKWEYKITEREVEVMATAKGYAMVRIKGCMPFVASEKDLLFPAGM